MMNPRYKLLYLGYRYYHQMPKASKFWLSDNSFQCVEVGSGYSPEEAVYDVLEKVKNNHGFSLSKSEQGELEQNLSELVVGRYIESPEDRNEKEFRLGLAYYVVMLFKKEGMNENEVDGTKV